MELVRNAEENLRPKVKIVKEKTKNDGKSKELFILKLTELGKYNENYSGSGVNGDRIKKSDNMQNENQTL